MKLAAKVVASLVAVISMILVTAVPAQAVVLPTLIRDNLAQNEYAPASTASYFAWSDAGFGRVYGMPRAGGAVFGVSTTSGPGFSSSPVTGGADQIIYQQTNSTRRTSDLYIFNLASKVRSALPLKVDSRYWEYSGVASTHYIFFDRLQGTWRYMLLYNRSTGALKVIARFKPSCAGCFRPTWVGATHAVYDQCSPRTGACDPRVRTIGGATAAVPVAAAPVSAYGASLDEATGNLYFIRSTLYCGIFVSIERANIASLGTQTDLYDTPVGIDLESTSLAPDVNGTDIDLLFTEFDCMAVDSGIYEIDQVNTL